MGIWWWFVPPGLVIVMYTGSLTMIGSAIDDVLNPKLTGVLRSRGDKGGRFSWSLANANPINALDNW
jgi:hypothetical protein